MKYYLIKPERKFVMIRLLRSFRISICGLRIPILKTVLYSHTFYDKKKDALWELEHGDHVNPETLRVIPVDIRQHLTMGKWKRAK